MNTTRSASASLAPFGEGLDSQFLGEHRVGLDLRELGELELEGIDDQVFGFLVNGLGQVLLRFLRRADCPRSASWSGRFSSRMRLRTWSIVCMMIWRQYRSTK